MPHLRVGLLAATISLLGCVSSAPLLPQGIADLRLPRDARSLARVATEEEPTGSITRRRELLVDVARQLLLSPPRDVLVPELFDLLVALGPRMESGTISTTWGSYVYTTYQRDLVRDRPTGAPRRSLPEVERAVDGYIAFFRLRAREGRKPETIVDAGFQDMQDQRDERRRAR
jgi:hypothetical protein